MKLIRISLGLGLIAAVLILSSCKKDSPGAGQVSFSTAAATYSESHGLVSIPVTLSPAQSGDVTVNYTWGSADTTTYLGGDFTFGTPSSITIPAGQTTGNIQLTIIDDTQVDGPDDVMLTLSSTSGNAIVTSTASAKTFDLTITDNDAAPANSMQLDLTWRLASGVTDDINGADLDLYLLDSVTVNVSDGSITSSATVRSSTNASGFETVILYTSDPDQDYYFLVNYNAGGTGRAFFAVSYTLGSNFINNTGYIGIATYLDSDYYIWDGPHTKTSNSVSRLMKPTTIGGKQYLRIRARDFIHKK